MELIASFFAVMITAIAMQNAVFTRALGIGKQSLFLKSAPMGMLFGGLLTWVLVWASIPVAVCNMLLEGMDWPYLTFVRSPVYLLCVCVVYVLTHFASKKYFPDWHNEVRRILPLATFNSALFAPFFVANNRSLNILETVAYALGSGIGYTIALLIIYYARKRLAISPIPRSFRGFPILLVYIGLLSLALYGLIGYNLPT